MFQMRSKEATCIWKMIYPYSCTFKGILAYFLFVVKINNMAWLSAAFQIVIHYCYFIAPFKNVRRQEANDLGVFLVTIDKKKSRNSKLNSIKRKQNKWGTLYEKVKQQIRKSSSFGVQLKMKNSIWEFAGFNHFENYQFLEIKTNLDKNTSSKKPQIPMTKISSALDMIEIVLSC